MGTAGNFQVAYVAVNGLAFETALFQQGAYEQAHTADNWARRARLARDSIGAVIRVRTEAGAGLTAR